MTTDANTLRRSCECLTHFGVVTAGVKAGNVLTMYGYTDYAAVYVTVPCSGAGQCSLPIAHLVKVLNTCMAHTLIRVCFHDTYLKVYNEVVYTVAYVDAAIPLEYPTVRSCDRFAVNLCTLNRFLKLVDETVTLKPGLKIEATFQSIVKSEVTFPPFTDPLYTLLDVPLPCNDAWPEDVRFSSTLLKYLCRTQPFQSNGVVVVCRNHLVYESARNDVAMKVCFTSC